MPHTTLLSALRRTRWLLYALLALFSAQAALAADDTLPRLHAGKKWRIGYFQGGPYESYQDSLQALVRGLMELGWIRETSVPEPDNPRDTESLWQWLAHEADSKYIEFVEDAYWNTNWDKRARPHVRNAVLYRLNEKKDIDLMIVMGTAAGQDMANNQHDTPTLIGSTTNPITSNIIKSVEDSGYDHIHARVDPTRHEQQVRLFHDIIGFKRLGIVHENSLDGRAFGGIDSVEKVAKERGFELIRCYAEFKDLSTVQVEKNVADCHAKLAPRIDAIYITRHPGVTLENMPALLAPLEQYRVPSFSQGASDEVEHGVLFSISLAKFKYVGLFYAQTIAKIFNGHKPRDLPQLFQSPPKIAINLATAQRIHYDPPIDILGAADEIYQDIMVKQRQPAKTNADNDDEGKI